MARNIFSSFHYAIDHWRSSTVRSIGAIEGNKLASDNDWESITERGDSAIENWIDEQMYGRSCVIVLVGEYTAGRKWINYEIQKAWSDGRGLLGIHIHGLKNQAQQQSKKGANPFMNISVNGQSLNNIVKCYDPPFLTSTYVYDHIRENIVDWIETAIEIRKRY